MAETTAEYEQIVAVIAELTRPLDLLRLPSSSVLMASATAKSWSVNTVHHTHKKSFTAFLALPLEIRNQVYRYLLSTEYTEGTERRYTWRDYCSFYDLEVGILSTNRQINHEATHILRANQFVWLTMDFQDADGLPLFHDVPFSTPDLSSQSMNHCVLKVAISLYYWDHPAYKDYSNTRIPVARIFATKDLTIFCRNLRAHNDYYNIEFFETIKVSINIHAQSTNYIWNMGESFPCNTAALVELLSPFQHRFHSVPSVSIDEQPRSACWPLAIDTTYDARKEAIMEGMQKPKPSTEEMILKATFYKVQGDAAFEDAQYKLAIAGYNNALSELSLQTDLFGFSQRHVKIDFDSEERYNPVQELVCQEYELPDDMTTEFVLGLWTDKAATHLKLGEYEDAYVWATAASWECDWYGFQNASGPLLSSVFFNRALACEGLGNVARAARHMEYALENMPDSKVVEGELRRLKNKADFEEGENLQAGMAALCMLHSGTE